MEDKKREMEATITQKSTKEEIADYFLKEFNISEADRPTLYLEFEKDINNNN